MNACHLSLSGMDVGACFTSLFLGWVPDWLWMLLPYWPWVVVIGGAGVAYRFAGWPGVSAFFGVVGFVLGRRTAHPEVHEHVSGKDALPSPSRPKHRPTIFGK